ncbi:PLP-dependent aminotransferase family protein [Iningainema tapete]|uniref:PLP-dependent aminotransferase family protein n=1 Tax=Iningainema tapete BLCC-T55 TaxID=2748662 RepID=A0A8J6XKB2_9CYAN|nr:PLP-dependent aminotransferase family protein [Iningainema tapete]MBD2774507.1 PLP-dependent aminotransferase family protein [Iningainema tapete BLCC-T55]
MDLAIALDSNSPIPLHQQLYEELRQAILSGRLLPGERILSTRTLAKSLSISRSTVTTSYEQLLSEGYLETIVGSGTFVCTQLPDDLLRSTSVESAIKITRPQVKLSGYGATLIEADNFLRVVEPELPINFRYGRPALEQFPIKLWRKLLSRYCCSNLHWLDYSTDLLGDKPLREAIARYLSRSRAVNCIPEQVLIVNGTQQALDLIVRLFIEPDDVIALEDPGYLSARLIFKTQGAKLLPIAVDESGLVVKDLAYSNEQIRLVYVTPSHQFPTGATLSLPRRLELLAWAQQTGALIIEDDYDSEYRYGDRPIPALQGLDQSDSVLYIGTFSKVLFPSLRIGYLVLPKSLVSPFAGAKWLSDRHLPLLEQQVLADFIEEGHLERHIRRMRELYDQRRQVLVKVLKVHFGDRSTILGEKAGLHLMVRLHTPLCDEEIIQRAASVGVAMMSAAPHYLKPHPSGEFIFGYGELKEQQLEEGILRLAKILTMM